VVERELLPGLAVPLWDRVALVRSDRQPAQVRTAAGDRLVVSDQAALGDGIWLVRTGLVLAPPSAIGAFEVIDSSAATFNLARLRRALADRPARSLGLRLDAQLRILEDRLGGTRSGVIIGCDGLPVSTVLQLRACLALHASTDDVGLTFGSVWSAGPGTRLDAGNKPFDGGGLVDVERRGRGLDAGAVVPGRDGG
jgi:hypothetical protein